MTHSYWLYQWIDARGVRTVDQARAELVVPASVNQMRDLAASGEAVANTPQMATDRFGLSAAAGLDLSGRLDCHHINCIKLQVDKLFRRTWHYFDYVVADDVWLHQVSRHWDDNRIGTSSNFLDHIELLLYLREIGADRLVHFSPKFPVQARNFEDAVARNGLAHIDAMRNDIAHKLALEGTVAFLQGTSSADWQFDSPRLEHSQWGKLDAQDRDGNPNEVREQIAGEIVDRAFRQLVVDVAASRRLELPLGATLYLHRQLLGDTPPPGDIRDRTAFALDLPVLANVDVVDLIALRDAEHDAFVRFRTAIRAAIAEQAQAGADERTSERIAREIRTDLVDNELAKIREILRQSKMTLESKGSGSILLGVLMTVAGVITQQPSMSVAGAGIGGKGVLDALNESSAASARIRESDMYFLWKAQDLGGWSDH